MKTFGNTLVALSVLIVALGGNGALGAVTASLDRDRVALGDTLQLTITATDDEELSDAELRPLLGDFEILQRSSSSNTSIVNGRMSQSRQMIIDLTPIREGNLRIPSLHVGTSTTPSLTVLVGAAPDTHTGGQPVVFEAEVDQHNVYVQGQVILTLRVLQSVQLEGRSISELKLDKAFVKPLEQHSFQRTIDGRQWLVDEVRYAIFPEQSGTLEIPAQVFSGRVNQGRRSFFDLGGSGQLVRRSTDTISINVLPKPDSFNADTWLPARRLTLEENWSTPPDQLSVGESATRTIRIQGEGLQGAQLPPIQFIPTEGLKYYPDQPQISEQETSSGLLGERQDSAAVVPTRPGTYLIPEIRVAWWDTQTEQVQTAVLPERKISVLAAPTDSTGDTAAPVPAPNAEAPPAAVLTPVPVSGGNSTLWQLLCAFSTLGWVVTLGVLWRQRHPGIRVKPAAHETISDKNAFKQLLAACTANDAARARTAVIAWAATINPGVGAVSLHQVARQFGDEEFGRQLELLNASLYRAGNVSWTGASLADSARRLRENYEKRNEQGTGLLQLYPQG
ncbi:MAG TPA: BatD family protein [Halioglobus sp.]